MTCPNSLLFIKIQIQIGDAKFRRYGADAGRASLGGGHDWVAWFGEIKVDKTVDVASFRASGLQVKVGSY